MKEIKNPKVFISYAWGTKEYQRKVLDFAGQLKRNGVEVLIDKWSVTGGNDLTAFMERCVNDKTVTNVIILLDKVYAEKADNREGGVGAETQIISQEVYYSHDQDRFIPVVFERDENGNICKPTYLKSRYHYDLSREDNFDTEYKKLFKHIFGLPIYIEPELGKSPDWLYEDITVTPKKNAAFDSLKENDPLSVKKEKFSDYLRSVSDSILAYSESYKTALEIPDEYLSGYEARKPIRTEYLRLIGFAPYVDDSTEMICDFLESTAQSLHKMNALGEEFGTLLIHEIFIYTVAGYMKRKDYSALGYILGRTYFYNQYDNDGHGFEIFYGGSRMSNLNNAMKIKDDKRYYSGTAACWMQSLDIGYCSKDDFILSDEICANYSVYGKDYAGRHKWFPVSYVHGNEEGRNMALLAKQLISKEKVNKLLPLFNYDSLEEFRVKLEDVENRLNTDEFRSFGYQAAWSNVPLIGHYIKASDVGKRR